MFSIKLNTFLFLTVCLTLSCSFSSEEKGLILTLISESEIDGSQNTLVNQPIEVLVTNQDNEPVEGVLLNTVTTGSVSETNPVTNSDGIATISWTLGEDYDQMLNISLKDDRSISVNITAIAKYKYSVPEDDNDGWIIGNIEEYIDNMNLFIDGIDKIRLGGYGEIHSILVIKDRKLLAEAYYPGTNSSGNFIDFDRFTKHEVQSASKSFRSALIGIAIDQGYIKAHDDSLHSFFPEFPTLKEEGKSNILLDNVLTMSSGFQWDESGGDLDNMYRLPYLQWHQFVISKPIQFVPGSTFEYNTGASIMLNRVIINSIDTGFNEFLDTYYASKVESAELPGVGGPIHALTTPRDMAKLGYVFLYDGYWKETKVLSKEWIDKSTEKRFNVGFNLWYGYQWWKTLISSEGNSYEINYANGNGGQLIIYNEELDLVVVSTGGKFGTAGTEIFDFISDYLIPAFK